MYYIYMLRCRDDSIYTGIAADLEKRMREHFEANPKSAKYVLSRGALKLEAFWTTEDRSLASKLESRIKLLTREKKLKLIEDNGLFREFLGEWLEAEDYLRAE